MEWRRNLASSLRRLEISLPHLGKIPSTVIHAASEDEIKYARVGDFITLRDPIARVKVEKSSRPYRLIAFNRNCKEAEILVPLIIEMSFVLEEIQHPIIDSERHWKQTIEKSSRFEIGLIDWLLCLHNFAHQLPETHVMNADDGQPRDWNETERLATLVEDTATASARMADWLLADQTVQESIDPGKCPVQLIGPGKPPILHGKPLPKPLSGDQYDIMVELVKAFPKGLSEKDFRTLEGTKYIGSPRHTLMGLRGDRVKKKTVWADVIIGPKNTRLGWRLKSR